MLVSLFGFGFNLDILSCIFLICYHISYSYLSLLNWLHYLSVVWSIVFCGFAACIMMDRLEHWHFFGGFYDVESKTFCRRFSDIGKYMLHLTGLTKVNIVMSVNTQKFYFLSICSVLNLVVFVWVFLPLCPHTSQLLYWKIFMIINEVFWVVMVDSHETWVHCWWWSVVINIWNYFSNSDSWIVCSFVSS